MNGRMLNDNDEILKLKVDNRSNIQAFISPRVGLLEDSKPEAKPEEEASEQSVDNKDAQVNIQDALNGQRGFDYFKINGYTVGSEVSPRRTRRSSGNGTSSTPTTS